MKISALRQMLHDLPDNMDVFFITDDGEEYLVDGTFSVPEWNSLYFGETQIGMEMAVENAMVQSEINDWAAREDAIEALERDEEEDDAAAPEGSDLASRDCCVLTADRVKPDPDMDMEEM